MKRPFFIPLIFFWWGGEHIDNQHREVKALSPLHRIYCIQIVFLHGLKKAFNVTSNYRGLYIKLQRAKESIRCLLMMYWLYINCASSKCILVAPLVHLNPLWQSMAFPLILGISIPRPPNVGRLEIRNFNSRKFASFFISKSDRSRGYKQPGLMYNRAGQFFVL